MKHPLFVAEIKFNLRFEGFRPNGFGCTSLRLAQWSFQPDHSKQLRTFARKFSNIDFFSENFTIER